MWVAYRLFPLWTHKMGQLFAQVQLQVAHCIVHAVMQVSILKQVERNLPSI